MKQTLVSLADLGNLPISDTELSRTQHYLVEREVHWNVLLREIANADPKARAKLLKPWRSKRAGAPKKHTPETDAVVLGIIERVRTKNNLKSDAKALAYIFDELKKSRGIRKLNAERRAETKSVSNILSRARTAAKNSRK